MTDIAVPGAPPGEDLSEPGERVAIEKHPRAIRWMHWFNFPILTIMIWSGLRIYWSYDVSRVPWIRFGEETFFPEGFYEVLQLNRQAAARLMAPHALQVVPGATHLFEEPGTLKQAAQLARDWFLRHLSGARP